MKTTPHNTLSVLRRTVLSALVALTLSFASAPALALSPTAGIDIIPRPLHIEQRSGSFGLNPQSVIYYRIGLKPQAHYLKTVLDQSTGWDLQIVQGAGKRNAINISVDTVKVTRDEGYTLDVTDKTISICGADNGGIFYGIQTLLQLFPPQIYSATRVRGVEWKVPAVAIADAPERPWRGMMLDVARYFYDKEFVKKYIDMMAMYKLNKLQFHLIDDSGWRLEIKKYPRLTQIGAWAGTGSNRLGGYYTQEDIKELIAYGELRNVEIIPEIEFPAHILSAIVAYPWLGCTGKQHEVPLQHFISEDLLCVGKESSITFLKDVLDETVDLFPSKYINIGGDEAVYSRWDECEECQKVVARQGLAKSSDLQGYLTNVVSDMMADKNRTIVGWEEIILRGKVKNPVVALIWHNVADSIHATADGHQAILTPASHMYLDFPEKGVPGEVKAAGWMPPITVEKCYSMEVNDYSPSSTVIGVQGCFWSDQFIHGTVLQEINLINENRSEKYAEYFTFPRLMAVSEVAWGKNANRNYADFADRLTRHYARLDNKNCAYRVPEPEIASVKQNADGKWEFTLAHSVHGATIRYTTEGSYPNSHSPIYNGEVVVVDTKSDLQAITVVSDSHYSLPTYFAPDYSPYNKYGVFAAQWQPLQIQTTPTPWRIEATGKISGNGLYEVTFISTKGANSLILEGLKLFKRDEMLVDIAQTVKTSVLPAEVATYRFTVDAFQAGTPFFIDVIAHGHGGNDTSGLVFVKKIE